MVPAEDILLWRFLARKYFKKLSQRMRGKAERSVLELIAQMPLEEQLGEGNSYMSWVWHREGNGNFLTFVCRAQM